MIKFHKPLQLVGASIRIAAFLFGCFVIIASIPLALIGATVPQETVPAVSPVLTVPLVACALAAGFLLFGIFGGGTASSPRKRLVTALLLVLPLASGAALLLAPAHQMLQNTGLFFFVPALVALFCTVWPGRWHVGHGAANNT